MIGTLIMAHSDDDGLVLPPRVAPQQIVIVPITPKEDTRDEVIASCEALAETPAEAGSEALAETSAEGVNAATESQVGRLEARGAAAAGAGRRF